MSLSWDSSLVVGLNLLQRFTTPNHVIEMAARDALMAKPINEAKQLFEDMASKQLPLGK